MGELEFRWVDPRSRGARDVLRRYLEETTERLGTPVFQVAELIEDVDEFAMTTGGFVLLHLDDLIVGCGAVRTLAPGVGELKRMWIDPAHRGRGLGARLLAELERRCVALGCRCVRLDTHRVLSEAIAMYRSHGYREIPRYNDNPDATHFFETDLPKSTPSLSSTY